MSAVRNIRGRVALQGAKGASSLDFTGAELLAGVSLPVEVDARSGDLRGQIASLDAQLSQAQPGGTPRDMGSGQASGRGIEENSVKLPDVLKEQSGAARAKGNDLPGGIVIQNIGKPAQRAGTTNPNADPIVDIIVRSGKLGSLSGQLGTLDARAEGARTANPVKGIGVVVKKRPGGESANRVADAGGKASFYLPPGGYTLRLDFASQAGASAGGARAGRNDPLVLDLSGDAGVEITFAADGVTVGKSSKVLSGGKWTGVEVEFTVAGPAQTPPPRTRND